MSTQMGLNLRITKQEKNSVYFLHRMNFVVWPHAFQQNIQLIKRKRLRLPKAQTQTQTQTEEAKPIAVWRKKIIWTISKHI